MLGLLVRFEGHLPHQVWGAVLCHMQGLRRHQNHGRVSRGERVQCSPLKHKRKKNAMAKHLDTYHPDKAGDPDNIEYSSVATFKKRLEWQISEGVAIMKLNAEVSNDRQNRILMNLKNNHRSLQPAVHSTTVSRQTRHGS